jgi:hypothetical protein
MSLSYRPANAQMTLRDSRENSQVPRTVIPAQAGMTHGKALSEPSFQEPHKALWIDELPTRWAGRYSETVPYGVPLT